MDIKRLMATDAGWGTTVTRIVTGVIFMGHGLPKIGVGSDRTIDAFAGWLGAGGLDLPFPMLMAILAVAAEVVGGFAMIVGFLIRPAALTAAIAMLVATAMVHWNAGMFGDGGYQWSLLLMCLSVAFVIDGAGKASLDRMLSRR